MSRSALVIGATGLVGRELVRQLAARPGFDRVVVLARRPLSASPGQNVETVIADFDHLERQPDAFRVTHLFCALGTTIRQAGSRERFRQVDYGYPLRAAELARAAGARHYLLVSSIGAAPGARGFYLRVKGELEEALGRLAFPSLTIVRPSLLLGDRAEFRLGERIATALAWSFPRKYRAVRARDVAGALVGAALDDQAGVRVIENREIERRDGVTGLPQGSR
jgi:uncharacterized protein YbjT (DUF2867 family)